MQIIIPMSGFGERFRRAGYKIPKPLIEIEGKPIIAHVIDMFPGEENFVFICNQDHLDNKKYNMENILNKYCPTGKVIGIEPHKLGPIHAVTKVIDYLSLDEPTIVNYCDFTCYWDWHHFKKFTVETNCDGAIPAYKGFHPHTLGSTNYAYMKESEGWVSDIQEKKPYTDNRMEEFASSGTYYFATGHLMKAAFESVVEQELSVGGEYYVSLAYKPLLEKKLRVSVYPLQHFMQWGTPQDVDEYNQWSNVFRKYIDKSETRGSKRGTVIIPMAGLGQRFSREGYNKTKPLIAVSGKPMVCQAIDDLPSAHRYSFVLRSDMYGYHEIASTLKKSYLPSTIELLSSVTQGQALTARVGLDSISAKEPVEGPITFGACDNGAIYNQSSFDSLVENPDVDVLVWVARGHPNAIRNPEMYGWVDSDSLGRIKSVSVKKPLNNPEIDPIIIGTFTFRNSSDFQNVVHRLLERDGKVNGEYYLDSCIEDAIALGLNCRIFEVENYISWGTPNDLRTFEYWQSCFHKWHGHPYSLDQDNRVPTEQVKPLIEKYSDWNLKLANN
ncbi:conserved hypothetical protein [Vibrio nigripulchritudo MADA3029]|uniref:sugar phosphate nucleotidyltransferase n=1 Tax=Vibrio nigripulchritudo TaxID=28173 RepID=UPI0003B1BA9E|nr:sugar phosphate nucleotidyltransferase [Vibrio nigripulchritudo]CCN47647.1 conserved hypothetical protein [Vibrio nigripulchritudo MADA3020]CCN56531.1 conserved hypothetical protein [Vibrio nigripulchritudo MADA3021]CCN58846.1 conserved hypothetical protein [Vibrio nigripulchritudo MADA3029]